MGFKRYPKWVYSKDQPARLVESVSEFRALGDGWFDNPKLTVPSGEDAVMKEEIVVELYPRIRYGTAPDGTVVTRRVPDLDRDAIAADEGFEFDSPVAAVRAWEKKKVSEEAPEVAEAPRKRKKASAQEDV